MITMLFFFFFQAEDGIRDGRVTGVQTCALPIYDVACGCCTPNRMLERPDGGLSTDPNSGSFISSSFLITDNAMVFDRSEERRVGKECRSRWWGYHDKKKSGEQR